MGRPAASALVQPSGLRAFDRRSKTAPEPADQPEPGASDGVQLPQLALGDVDREQVGVRAAFDARARRNRVRPRIRLVGVVEGDGVGGSAGRDDVVGDAVAYGVEVGMERGVDPDGVDHRVRVGGNRQARDVAVPHVGRREYIARRGRRRGRWRGRRRRGAGGRSARDHGRRRRGIHRTGRRSGGRRGRRRTGEECVQAGGEARRRLGRIGRGS